MFKKFKPPVYVCYSLLLLTQVLERKADILSLAASRKALLEDSLKLQQTLRDVDDVMAWANEKVKTASDESFRVSSTTLVPCWVVLR